MKEFKIKGGQRQRIVRKRFSSLPQTIAFEVESDPPGGELSGSVAVDKTAWAFGSATAEVPLEARHSLEKTMWNSFFSVTVAPNHDVTLRVTSGQDRFDIVLAIGVVFLLAVGSVIFMAVLRGGQ